MNIAFDRVLDIAGASKYHIYRTALACKFVAVPALGVALAHLQQGKSFAWSNTEANQFKKETVRKSEQTF